MAKTYNSKLVFVSFAGVNLSGMADGTFVRAERNEDSSSLVVGSQGEGARSINNNRSGKVTVTLLQTSQSNDFLSGRIALDELRNGAGKGELLVKDGGGKTLAHAEEAWIVKPSSVEFGREVGTREWTFETDDLALFVGGN